MTLSELRHGAVSVCEQHGMLTLSHLRQVTRPCDLMGSLPCTLAPAEPLLCPLWVQSQCAKRGGRASGWGRELNTQSVLYPLENPTSLPGCHLFFLPLFFILSFFFFKLNQAQALNPGAENGTELQSPASTS